MSRAGLLTETDTRGMDAMGVRIGVRAPVAEKRFDVSRRRLYNTPGSISSEVGKGREEGRYQVVRKWRSSYRGHLRVHMHEMRHQV